MKHFYQSIAGWFDYQDLYRKIVLDSPQHARFVEVGAWYGRSTAFLIVEIINSRKDISLDVVDLWRDDYGTGGRDPFDVFKENMERGGVWGRFEPVRAPSVKAVNRYEDEELDFIFLDASHDYLSVREDIFAWLPKVRTGGYLAGHDFNSKWPGVVKAVVEIFGSSFIQTTNCWLHRKGQ